MASPEGQPIVSKGSASHAVVPLSGPRGELGLLDPASPVGTPMVPWQAEVQRGAVPAPSQMYVGSPEAQLGKGTTSRSPHGLECTLPVCPADSSEHATCQLGGVVEVSHICTTGPDGQPIVGTAAGAQGPEPLACDPPPCEPLL
jgi:hypothetical protein